MSRLFIFGLGYSARFIEAAFAACGWEVISTGREGTLSFDDEANVCAALADSSHILSSIPPSGEGFDPVLERYGAALYGKWLGYLSSTGVYGDCGGAWVDETAQVVGAGGAGRRTARADCDTEWLKRGARVLRLPGIFGPGRSALDRVREGKVKRIDVPGQVFSRVHVEDIAEGVLASIDAPPGAYNLADDLPCSQNAVIAQACHLLGIATPPLLSLEEAQLSPMARAFYAENRRVANGKAKRLLGWGPRYPTFREGLAAILAAGG